MPLRQFYADLAGTGLDAAGERAPGEMEDDFVPSTLGTIVGEMLDNFYIRATVVGVAGDLRFGEGSARIGQRGAIVLVESIAGVTVFAHVAMDGQWIGWKLVGILHERSKRQDAVRAHQQWPAFQRGRERVGLRALVGLLAPVVEPETSRKIDRATACACLADGRGE